MEAVMAVLQAVAASVTAILTVPQLQVAHLIR